MEIECAYCFEMLLVLKERTKVLKTEVGKQKILTLLESLRNAQPNQIRYKYKYSGIQWYLKSHLVFS